MSFQISREFLYRIYLLLCILILTKALTWLYTGQGTYILDAAKSKGMRIHTAIHMFMLLSLLVYNWKTLLFSPALRWGMVIFGYFALSAIWAYDFIESVRMSLSILFQISIATAITRGATLNQMLSRLATIAKGIILINLFFIICFNSLAIEPGYFGGSYSGALRGIFSSKNTFGAILAFAYSVIILHFVLNSHKKQLHTILWLILAFTLLILSMSVTSIATALFTTMIVGITSSNWFLRASQHSRVFMLLFILTTFCISIALLEPVLNAFGRDLTFTGRTILWTFSLENFAEKPIIGYGLNSFWREMLVNDTLAENGLWNIGQAHNGFIDALLAGGIIGGTLVILLYCKMLYSIISELVRTTITPATSILIVFFWLCLIQNLTETSFPYGIRITGTIIILYCMTLHTIQKSRHISFHLNT